MRTGASPSSEFESPFVYDGVHHDYVCKGCGWTLDLDEVMAAPKGETGMHIESMRYCPLCGYPSDGKAGDDEVPERYSHGGVECIDAIRSALTREEFRGFCKGNVLKYVWREAYKGGPTTCPRPRATSAI